MGQDITRANPDQIEPGEEYEWYDNATFGGYERKGIPVQKTKAQYDFYEKQAEAACTFQVSESGGATCQIGRLLEIDGEPDQTLKLEMDPVWRGFLNQIGLGTCEITFLTYVADDDTPEFTTDKSDWYDSQTHVQASKKNGGSDAYEDWEMAELYVEPDDISDGDVLRFATAVTVSGTADRLYSSSEADAFTDDDTDNYPDGHISYGTVTVSWT
ncbi:hypothetical protein [Haloarcula salinisoli]|uniref:Uncharacterized protein n=1 Tax=Haloarcula salinisoli TaxID=2487746 RepID=A0A8J7YM40_9EURY|nr:hypothetical protein [Halomicroarcula salinisoli]MBX0288454.1 hypothetical protein [Halomicroarcula salinisoli]MBX0305724.1 hypothetical protein [Halomicroarcula salinisoli]